MAWHVLFLNVAHSRKFKFCSLRQIIKYGRAKHPWMGLYLSMDQWTEKLSRSLERQGMGKIQGVLDPRHQQLDLVCPMVFSPPETPLYPENWGISYGVIWYPPICGPKFTLTHGWWYKNHRLLVGFCGLYIPRVITGRAPLLDSQLDCSDGLLSCAHLLCKDL